MLNEIINAIGEEHVNEVQKNCITTNNTIYVRINFEQLNKYDITYIKKEILPNQLDLIEWCKDREIFSKILDSHKAINVEHYKKVINSCVPYSIMFNWENFIKKDFTKKQNIRDGFYILLKEYLNVFDKIEYIDYYLNVLDEISNIIKKNKLKDNVNIKLFLNVDIKKYRHDYLEYLKEKIFDKEGIIYQNGNEKFGRCTKFYTLNKDKPLLFYMDNIKDIHLLSATQARLICNLYNYMANKKEEAVNLGIQQIHYKMAFNKATATWYIQDVLIDPYGNKEEHDNIYFNIQNILNLKKFKETSINNYKDLKKYLYYLIDGNIQKINNQYQQYIDRLNHTNILQFKQIYTQFMRLLYNFYSKKDNIYKISTILNFNICMQDWLFKNNMKGIMINMFNMLKEKIGKNNYNIDTNEEFFFMSGQMVKYLKLKTHTDNITNRLFNSYIFIKQTSKMIELLTIDKNKLDYDASAKYSGRSNNMMSAILEYYIKHKEELKLMDIVYFDYGLYYGENLIYTKKGNDDNDNNEE